MRRIGCLSLLAAVGLIPLGANGAPSFVYTTNQTSDLSADGNTTLASILDPNVDRLIRVYTRGVGFTTIGPVIPGGLGSTPKMSDQLPPVVAMSLYNGAYAPAFDLPTFGYYNLFGQNVGHLIAHRFDPGTGMWANCGGWPSGTGGAGMGSSKCDINISNTYDISSNGRFVVGSGMWGAYGGNSCSPRGFVYDHNSGSMKILPYIGTNCSSYAWCYARAVSTNGLVVAGPDSHMGPSDPSGLTAPVNPTCNVQTLSVWERSSDTAEFLASGQTILDRFGSGQSGWAMTRGGTAIAATLSANAAQYDLGNAALAGNLVKYTKPGASWNMVVLGRVVGSTGNMTPLAISDDGNTIVGSYSGGSFIWRPSINGGVPMHLNDYVASLNGGNPFPPAGTESFFSAQAISADGNAILGGMTVGSGCAQDGLGGGSQYGVLYLNGVPCEPPQISGGPYNQLAETYLRFGITMNVFAVGSFPLTWQWQKETPTGSNNWVNLTNSCGTFSADDTWSYDGVTGPQLRINMLIPPAQRDGNYRVQITNPCGTVNSPVASAAVLSGACCYIPEGQSQVVCSIEMESRCTGPHSIGYFAGTYLGDGTTCGPNICDTVSGACCYGSGGPNANCVIDIPSHCTDAVSAGGRGGNYAGHGTTCSPTSCASVSAPCCYSPDDVSNAICALQLTNHCTRARMHGGLSGTIGAGTTCAPSACQNIIGACCFSPSVFDPQTLTYTFTSDVICSLQAAQHCTNDILKPSQPSYVPGLAGLFAGPGQACSPSNLCSAVSGACCYVLDAYTDAVCTIQLQDNCIDAFNAWGLGGAYGGTGSTCASYNCATSTGACCHIPTGETCTYCTITPAARCSNPINIGGLAGTYGGNNTVCTIGNCPAAVHSACCIGEDCAIMCEGDCTLNEGEYQGAGSVCDPSPCSATGLCCFGSVCLADVASNDCTGPNRLFLAGLTTCNPLGPVPPRDNKQPCCKADYNHVNGITVQDLFDYLAGWFGKVLQADINGAVPSGGAAVTVQDLFDFLAAWFAKGCP